MAATTSNNEFDQILKKAIILLHSPHSNSATELRLMLDEALKQRYGPEKMLSNTLNKRHLDLEKTFPGRAATPPPQPEQPEEPVADEVINLTHSPAKTISDSPETMVVDSDDAMSGTGMVTSATTEVAADVAGSTLIADAEGDSVDDDGNLKDFGDLNCCVCGEMMFTATNRLIECSKCGTLYHQECHKPPISEDEASGDQEHNWVCDTCFNKPSTSKAAGIVVVPDEPIPLVTKSKSSATSSRSSSSSNSSSPFYKQEQTSSTSVPTTTSSTSSKHHHKSSSSSSSRSQKEEHRSSSKAISATVNIPEKNSSSHSGRKSSHSSKSSSTKSSKHHEGSSSKRKSSK